MTNFVAVQPEEVPNFRQGHRGRVSYPILKSFLETGYKMAMMDREGTGRTAQHLYGTLGAYIEKHNMPIKLFTRNNELYLMRTDLDNEGNPLEEDGDE